MLEVFGKGCQQSLSNNPYRTLSQTAFCQTFCWGALRLHLFGPGAARLVWQLYIWLQVALVGFPHVCLNAFLHSGLCCCLMGEIAKSVNMSCRLKNSRQHLQVNRGRTALTCLQLVQQCLRIYKFALCTVSRVGFRLFGGGRRPECSSGSL